MSEEIKKTGITPEIIDESDAKREVISSDEYMRVKARNLSFMDPVRLQTMKMLAETFKSGGALPTGIDTVPKMVVVFQAGYESGLQPIESLNSFYFVNGKVAMYGEAVIRQVIKAGHIVDWGVCNANEATVTITRGDTGKSLTSTLTMIEANKRGLNKGPVWTKFPESMLRYRVFGMTARFIAPDALGGIKIAEEMDDYNPDRIVVTGEKPKDPKADLNAFLNQSDEPTVDPEVTPPVVDIAKKKRTKKDEEIDTIVEPEESNGSLFPNEVAAE